MPKYWEGNYFAQWSFPEVGQKQKTEKKEEERERAKVGDSNGKATQFTQKQYFFLHIYSSYAKILGETNFHTREFPRSGSKAKNRGKNRPGILLKPSASKNSGWESFHKNSVCSDHQKL